MATIDGITYTGVYYHGDGAIYYNGATGNVVAKRKIVNGHDNTGYTERFRLFGNIHKGTPLPSVYPASGVLLDLGWNYDTAKRLGGQPIHTVFGPSGARVTGLASTTYIYGPSGITGPSGVSLGTGTTGVSWPTGYAWVQEKVEIYVDGVLA